MAGESEKGHKEWRLSGDRFTATFKTRKNDIFYGVAFFVSSVSSILLGVPHFTAKETAPNFDQAISTVSKSTEENVRNYLAEELKRRDKRLDERHQEMKADIRELRTIILSRGRR